MNVVMPQLGETVKEATITAWHVKIGDRVAADGRLLDIETDKASSDIPSPATGTVVAILFAAGQSVGAGTVLAVIRPDVTPTDAHTIIPADNMEPRSPVPENPAMACATIGQASHAMAPASPAVRRLFREHGLDAAMVTGTGKGGVSSAVMYWNIYSPGRRNHQL